VIKHCHRQSTAVAAVRARRTVRAGSVQAAGFEAARECGPLGPACLPAKRIATLRARDRALAGVDLGSVPVAASLVFSAERGLLVRPALGFSVGSAEADAVGVVGGATFAKGLRPSPSSFAKVERRSEYAGAVRR
jgi:hypothetical protein